jgi:hypothetical protein
MQLFNDKRLLVRMACCRLKLYCIVDNTGMWYSEHHSQVDLSNSPPNGVGIGKARLGIIAWDSRQLWGQSKLGRPVTLCR